MNCLSIGEWIERIVLELNSTLGRGACIRSRPSVRMRPLRGSSGDGRALSLRARAEGIAREIRRLPLRAPSASSVALPAVRFLSRPNPEGPAESEHAARDGFARGADAGRAWYALA